MLKSAIRSEKNYRNEAPLSIVRMTTIRAVLEYSEKNSRNDVKAQDTTT